MVKKAITIPNGKEKIWKIGQTIKKRMTTKEAKSINMKMKNILNNIKTTKILVTYIIHSKKNKIDSKKNKEMDMVKCTEV